MGRPLGSKNKAKTTETKFNVEVEVIKPEAEGLPELDKSKPYAEVCGLPGATFEQNGKFFNKDGFFVPEENCQPINDDPDPPQPEEYHGYNQVILQESPRQTPSQSKEIARHIVYGDVE